MYVEFTTKFSELPKRLGELKTEKPDIDLNKIFREISKRVMNDSRLPESYLVHPEDFFQSMVMGAKAARRRDEGV